MLLNWTILFVANNEMSGFSYQISAHELIRDSPIMTYLIFLFVMCAVLSAVVIRFATYLALVHRIADHPGEHKNMIQARPLLAGQGY